MPHDDHGVKGDAGHLAHAQGTDRDTADLVAAAHGEFDHPAPRLQHAAASKTGAWGRPPGGTRSPLTEGAPGRRGARTCSAAISP
ncbi:hypothetical protein [Neoroseomonas soli]|uniref:Uncharacterized protein n=1 Tax=Neoroseomonas soli TaxID=1081025 RepID=A0A9X9WRB6_9PROT|nr:hypothetical protein [Neoroseomonas soli]MBR0669695.1 hypothetical protein [Neoroseomonas soli]